MLTAEGNLAAKITAWHKDQTFPTDFFSRHFVHFRGKIPMQE
jgi:hypothetical protein